MKLLTLFLTTAAVTACKDNAMAEAALPGMAGSRTNNGPPPKSHHEVFMEKLDAIIMEGLVAVRRGATPSVRTGKVRENIVRLANEYYYLDDLTIFNSKCIDHDRSICGEWRSRNRRSSRPAEDLLQGFGSAIAGIMNAVRELQCPPECPMTCGRC